MQLNNKLKTKIFKFLELLPKSWGDTLYHHLQCLNSRSIFSEYNLHRSTIEKFAVILKSVNLSFEGKRIIEIGSGWLPVIPYELIFRYKAKEVLTFDINEHYQKRLLKEFNQFYSRLYSVNLTTTLPASIRYFPRTNILKSHFTNSTINAVISRNVLEHIPPDDLIKIHKQAYDYLTPDDGFIIHLISPSDHRAYSDPRISLWDFLQYSQKEWDQIQTRFDYHNRWRLPQYMQMFENCGFYVEFLSYKTAREGQKLPVKIHSDFIKYSQQELTAGNVIVILRPNNR
ncbi:MAG: class I SAM-dependent methyltransferase [Flavobacteriales bacterium]|nr:class I SAM-dependent methyltransferase [Flavobacteriales bacterium]